MSDSLSEVPKTNVDLLKLLVASDGLAEKLVEAASSNPKREEALATTKAVLLSEVEAKLAKLKDGKNQLG